MTPFGRDWHAGEVLLFALTAIFGPVVLSIVILILWVVMFG